MDSRAERRRAARQLGAKRATGKRGRRPSIRLDANTRAALVGMLLREQK